MKKYIRLLKKLYKLNYEAYINYKDRKRFSHCFNRSWEEFPIRVFEEQSPVFFLSTGRCGTALVSKVLDKVPDVACFHKPTPELVYMQRKAYEEGLKKFDAYKIAICAARFDTLAECVVRKKTYIETNCRITFFAHHLRELFPNSRFVHLVRHPGEFVRSAVRRKYYEGHFLDIGRIRPLSGQAFDAWPEMTAFSRAAWLWNETNRHIESFKKICEPNRILTINSDDIFSNPETMIAIIKHCGHEPPSISTISKLISQPVNAQKSKDNVPPYHKWQNSQKNEVMRWALFSEKYGFKF